MATAVMPSAGTPGAAPAVVPSAPPAAPAPASGPGADQAAASGGAAQRGPDGRFVSGKALGEVIPGVMAEPEGFDARGRRNPPPSPSEGVPADLAADATPTDPVTEQPTEEAPASKFKFAGREWDSPAHAEQSFRTLQGQFRSLQTAASTNSDVAWKWKQAHDALAAKLNEGNNQAGTATAPGQPEKASASAPNAKAETARFVEGLDWGLYRELYQKHGPDYAGAWLTNELDRHVGDRLSKLEERFQQLQPLEQEQAGRAAISQVTELFRKSSEYQNPDGTPYYPELHDAAATTAIARLWTQLGYDERAAMTPQAVHTAVLHYRDLSRRTQANPNPNPSATAAAEQIASSIQASQAARGAIPGNAAPSLRPASAGPETDQQRFKRSIRDAGQMIPGLGFAL